MQKPYYTPLNFPEIINLRTKMFLRPGDLPPNSRAIYEIRLLEKIVYTSRLGTGKPHSYNHHIYHFHVLEFPNLIFCFIFCGGRVDQLLGVDKMARGLTKSIKLNENKLKLIKIH